MSKYFNEIRDNDLLTFVDDKNCVFSFFHCYSRGNNIFGIQNHKTGKFIGSTIFGNIAVSGNYLGKQEEIYIEYLARRRKTR